MAKRTAEERFWAKVDRRGPDECWIWTAYRDPDGYGQFGLNGRNVKAHRYAYEQLVGPIPDRLETDHLCRVRECVNPAHLEPVWHLENVRRGGNAAKTHCPQGHPYSGANLRIRPRGDRQCRTCDRLRSAAYQRRLTLRQVTPPDGTP